MNLDGATVRLSAYAAAGATFSYETYVPPRYFLVGPRREIGWSTGSAFDELTFHTTEKTVVLRDGVWRAVSNRRQDWLDACDVVFRGGYVNEVTADQAVSLEAAGFTVVETV